MKYFRHFYCAWLGISLGAFGDICFDNWRFYAIVIPTILSVIIFHEAKK